MKTKTNTPKPGDMIASIRKTRGLHAKELAKMVGVSDAYLSSIENNYRRPSGNLLRKMAEALGFPFEVFMIEIIAPNLPVATKHNIAPVIKLVLELFFPEPKGKYQQRLS